MRAGAAETAVVARATGRPAVAVGLTAAEARMAEATAAEATAVVLW